jgi:hypothetical protein
MTTPVILDITVPVVIDKGRPAEKAVAAAFHAPLVPAKDAHMVLDRPLILVAASVTDLPGIRNACEHPRSTVTAVVAWNLPETTVGALLDLPNRIRVYIGLPSGPDQPPADRATERALAADLANLERLLARATTDRRSDAA